MGVGLSGLEVEVSGFKDSGFRGVGLAWVSAGVVVAAVAAPAATVATVEEQQWYLVVILVESTLPTNYTSFTPS